MGVGGLIEKRDLLSSAKMTMVSALHKKKKKKIEYRVEEVGGQDIILLTHF